MAIIYSFTFCITLLKILREPSPVNNCFANCCEIVLPPPSVPSFIMADNVRLKSIPL